MVWERSGYKHTSLGEGGRFKGIYVHVYNNQNGKYGFVELGTSHDLRKLNRIESELMEYLFYLSIDKYTKNEDAASHETYKYSIDFVDGFKAALETV